MLATIVTCVEAGQLESQTLRMIESLRKWGGAFSRLPVIAVTPRYGIRIASETKRRFNALDVTYIRTSAVSKYAWYNFINKPTALLAAEKLAKVDTMIWLDGDLLIVNEPRDLQVDNEHDFTACPTEKNIGTSGPDDPYNPYWIAVCKAVGLEVEDLPWVTEWRANQKIRLYFNGGVLAYRAGVGCTEAFLETTERILDAKIRLPKDGIFYHEQAAIGLAVVKQKLRWRVLDESCNFHFGSMTQEHVVLEKLRTASVLHYHRSMQSDRWEKFLKLIEDNHPKLMDWLKPQGPLKSKVPPLRKPLNKLIHVMRKRKSDNYLAGCRTV